MTTIKVNIHPNDITESEVYADVAAVISQDMENMSETMEIRPETAVAIASWWQSPGAIGHVLACFASGAEVDREELLSDIHQTRLHHGYYTHIVNSADGETHVMSQRDRDALDCLSTFVIGYGR